MKKFAFPLRSVAIVRNSRESQARQAFAAAVHTLALAEETLAEARRGLDELREMLLNRRSMIYRAPDQAAFLTAFQMETRREMEAHCAVVEAQSKVQQKRQEWMTARQGVRVVQNLENKARAVHRHEVERAEQSTLDDLAMHCSPSL